MNENLSVAEKSSSADHTRQSALDPLQAIEKVWLTGIFDPAQLPDGIERERLVRLLSDIQALHQYVLAIANGDLTASLKIKGRIAGSLKSLQANLRHLTWQTQMIAQGDFTQRVDFMGEFSRAFNAMVQSLEQARSELQQANQELQKQLDENRALQKQLREQAIRDPLTHLFNRRYLMETLERELACALRDTCPVSVIMLDIDHFKQVNDTYGHKAGDVVLVALGELLRTQIRAGDVACRYGGEEFVAVLPGASVDVARERAGEWRARMEKMCVRYEEHELHATLSLGVAAHPQHGSTGEALLRAADQALYAAKTAGRNRVVVWN